VSPSKRQIYAPLAAIIGSTGTFCATLLRFGA
jgi:hypothetical protein